MIQYQGWPPPKWTEVVIEWNYILNNTDSGPRCYYEWCHDHNSRGRFHVHGWRQTEGFAFRFEYPKDANWFILRWS